MRPLGGVNRAALLRDSEQSQWPRLASGRYPGLPYVVMTIVLLVSGISGALFCMLPADPDALLYGAGATTLLLVAAVLVWFVGPKVPNGWGLDAGLAVPGLVVVGAASVAMSPQAQVLVALAMMLFGVEIFVWPGGPISAVHNTEDLERTCEAFGGALRLRKEEGAIG